MKDKDGNSLLLVAASHGHADLIELLFKLNLANILDQNDAGNDALIEAALNEKTSAAIVLLKHGADLSVVNKEGRSAYQYCATIPGFLSQWVSFALRYFCAILSKSISCFLVVAGVR